MVTRDEVLGLAPELSVVEDGDARWAFFAEEANRLSQAVWGDLRPYAMLYLVAHKMTVSVRGAASGGRGAVTSESVGGVSRTYATVAGAGPTDYETTIYGAEYKRMLRRVAGGPA
jgi:hypothetical protein